jgi:hypothetical protein
VDGEGGGADLHRSGYGGRELAVVCHFQSPVSGAGQTNAGEMCVHYAQICCANPGTDGAVEKISEFLQKNLFLLAELV